MKLQLEKVAGYEGFLFFKRELFFRSPRAPQKATLSLLGGRYPKWTA